MRFFYAEPRTIDIMAPRRGRRRQNIFTCVTWDETQEGALIVALFLASPSSGFTTSIWMFFFTASPPNSAPHASDPRKTVVRNGPPIAQRLYETGSPLKEEYIYYFPQKGNPYTFAQARGPGSNVHDLALPSPEERLR